jgi:uncharacterized protein (TIGR00369 family)
MAGTEHTRRYSWFIQDGAEHSLSKRDGIAHIRAQIDDPTLLSPIAHMVGWHIESVEAGRVRLALPVEDHLIHSGGVMHGGLLSALADSAAANAVISQLKKGQSCTTMQLNMNFMRPIRRGAGLIHCEGRVVKPGSRAAYAEAIVTDQAGTVCVTASSTLMIFAIE